MFADLATNILLPDISLDQAGIENLEKVRQLASEGKQIIFMSNHLSNLDAPALVHSLSRNGFEDISKKFVFLLGMKLIKNPLIRQLTSAYRHIRVWPPSLESDITVDGDRRLGVHRKAINSVREALENGEHLVIFPETTRSRNGRLMHGHPSITHFMPDESIIVPVGIVGSEDALPPGKLWPKNYPIKVVFGEPIPLKELMDKSLQPKERRIKVMVQIMKAIASILPEGYQGVYK